MNAIRGVVKAGFAVRRNFNHEEHEDYSSFHLREDSLPKAWERGRLARMVSLLQRCGRDARAPRRFAFLANKFLVRTHLKIAIRNLIFLISSFCTEETCANSEIAKTKRICVFLRAL